MKKIECRKGCGACCIALAISSPIPDMPGGKPSGVRCFHLLPENICDIHGSDKLPKTCRSFQACYEYCGSSRTDALERLSRLQNPALGPMGP